MSETKVSYPKVDSSEFTGRRLPVFLVLDCSGSMGGEAIESVKMGVKALLADLRSDPQALETVYLSIILFSTDASITPLTELALFSEPTIQASGSTNLRAALEKLEYSINTDVRKSSPTIKGDWRPLVFVMTDGFPDCGWESAADRVKQSKPGNIIACAAGPGADKQCLLRITETVIELANLQPDQLKAFFKWMSASVCATSKSIAQAGSPVALPNLPTGITIVP